MCGGGGFLELLTFVELYLNYNRKDYLLPLPEPVRIPQQKVCLLSDNH